MSNYKALQDLYCEMNEAKKLKKQDIKTLTGKEDEQLVKDITKSINNKPIQYMKQLTAGTHKIDTMIQKYVKQNGMNNNDPDLLLLATAIAAIESKLANKG